MDNKNSNVEDDAEAASSERLLEPNQAQNISNSREQGRKLHSKMMLGIRFHALKGFMFGSEDGRKEFRALGQRKKSDSAQPRGFISITRAAEQRVCLT